MLARRVSRRSVIAVAAASAATLAFAPAWGAGRTAQSESFFASGNASAHWDNSQSADDDSFSQVYEVNDASSYAGARLHHVEGLPAPANAPSFDFKADRPSPADIGTGGSPRLVIVFSDGGNINLRPLMWTGDWQHEGGDSGPTASDWDNVGGTCGSEYEQDYQTVKNCHDGALVTAAFMVTDSFWKILSPYKNWVDNVQYDGKTISQPSDNSNS